MIVLAQGKHERKEAADFIVGFFIARIPILLFQAIQAALLPKLAALSGAGKYDDFRSGLKKLVMIVVGVGLLGIVAGATIGPTVGQILFGDKFNLSNQDLTLLFVGSAAFILALTLAQALIALLGHGRALIAWTVGLVLCVGVMGFGSHDLFLRAELGYLAGCLRRRGHDGDLPADPPPLGDPGEPQPPRRGHRARAARDLARCARPSPAPAGSSDVTSRCTSPGSTSTWSTSTSTDPPPSTSPTTTRSCVASPTSDPTSSTTSRRAATSGQSWGDGDLLTRVNVDGTRHVLDACALAGRRSRAW